MKNYILIFVSFFIGTAVFGQTTWYEIPTGTNKKLNSIDFPSNNVGYIVGNDSTILKTTNGGQTWTNLGMNGISISSLSDDFTDIDFIDENKGFLISQYSGVWKTVDGGQSWTQESTSMCFPETLYPFDETNYLIGGGDCFSGAKIDKVVNSVATPATITADFWFDYEIVLEMSFANSLRGLAAVRNEFILRTTDGGNNWDTVSTIVPGALTSVVMVDELLCYAGYEDSNSQGFGILKSEDGGLTWYQDVNSATFFYPDYLCVHASGNGDIYSGGVPSNSPGGLIFESTDGVNWDYFNVDQPINDITSYGSDITFGIGDSGYLVVNTPIAELSVGQSELLGVKVYPNPVVEELIIETQDNSSMDIRISDVSGSAVRTLKSQVGLTIIDLSSLKNGVYFVEIRRDEKIRVERIVKK